MACLLAGAGARGQAVAAPAEPAGPPAVGSPAPTVLPAPPVVAPGPGVYYPDWQELGPNERFASPEPEPGGLPRHVGLSKAEKEAVERLRSLVARLEGHLSARRLASARVALAEAEGLVSETEARYLFLKVHASWSEPRLSLIELRSRYATEREGPVDDESLAVAEAGLRELEARLAPLWKGLERLAPTDAEQRLLQLRRLVREAGEAPLLKENPGWLALRAPLMVRLEKAEAALAVRVGQVRLVDAIWRIDRLRAVADERLASGEVEAAVGDLQALEEACAGFEHEYGELTARGYDPAGLVWAGVEGEWKGRAVLARVQRWRQEARRRLGVLGHPAPVAPVGRGAVATPPPVPSVPR